VFHGIRLRYTLVILTVSSRAGLRDGRPMGRSLSPGGGKNFHFSMSSTPALGPTQTPIELSGSSSPGKAAGE
jgi:hypothetical protein